MSMDVRTRAVAAFAALSLASLLTTSAAIAGAGTSFAARQHAAFQALSQTAPIQVRSAHIAKASAIIALRSSGRRY